MRGVIVEGRGGLYTVRDGQGAQYVLRAQKKFRRDEISPLPGDRVVFTPRAGEEHGWLEKIEPRTSLCLRPLVANIELMVLVAAPEPSPDWLLIDKLLLLASIQQIAPVLVINKCDLDGGALLEQARAVYRGARLSVVGASARTGEGLEDVRWHMRGRLSCLAGQSGVGKSALLSRLLGVELLSGSISRRVGRGRQTTRHTTLLYKDGLQVLDTPGFSLLEIPADLEPAAVPQHYPEFEGLGPCRFQPCLHLSEPGCLVRQAVDRGQIDQARMARYQELMALVREVWDARYK